MAKKKKTKKKVVKAKARKTKHRRKPSTDRKPAGDVASGINVVRERGRWVMRHYRSSRTATSEEVLLSRALRDARMEADEARAASYAAEHAIECRRHFVAAMRLLNSIFPKIQGLSRKARELASEKLNDKRASARAKTLSAVIRSEVGHLAPLLEDLRCELTVTTRETGITALTPPEPSVFEEQDDD